MSSKSTRPGSILEAAGLVYPHDPHQLDIGPGSLTDRSVAYYAGAMPGPIPYKRREADIRRCEMARAEVARRARLDADIEPA